MRTYGGLHPTDYNPGPPDTVGSVILSSAGAIVAQDYPAGAQLVLFSGTVDFYANLGTTFVAIPSTNQSGTTASSGLNELNPGLRQVRGSTGYSLTGPSSGVITASFWKI